MYELSDSDSGISFTGGGGDGNGGGIPTKFTTRQRLEKAINVTDQVLRSAEMISAIDEFISLATKSGSKEFYKLMGKVGGKLSNVTGVVVSGLEYTNGKISGLELTFNVGASVGSIWISAQVGATFGGGWGFVAGAATGVVSEYVIKPLYTNYVYPQLVVPTQKIYNSSWTGFYNNIIFNISRYH